VGGIPDELAELGETRVHEFRVEQVASVGRGDGVAQIQQQYFQNVPGFAALHVGG